MEAERQFFQKEDAYRHIMDKMGTKYLQQTLNKELKEHIMAKMPQMRRELQQKLMELNEELEGIGYDENSAQDPGQVIVNLLFSFQDTINYSIEGSGNINSAEITGGVYINKAFYKEFGTFFDESINNTEDINKAIGIGLTNEHGFRNTLFASERVFDMAVGVCLKNYESPVVSCVQYIRDILADVLEESLQVLQKYPKFKELVDELVKAKLTDFERDTIKHLMIQIEAHKAFMNTKHPQFNNALVNMANPEQDKKTPPRTSANKNFSYSGKLTVVLPGSKNAREADCTLTIDKFIIDIPAKTFLSSESRKEKIGLDNIECHSKTAGMGQRIFVLQRTDGKPVLGNLGTFEMMSSIAETEAWVQAFTTIGIFKDISGSMADLLGNSIYS